MTLIGVLRHERHHVYIEVAQRQHQNLYGGILAVSIWCQCGRIFLPVLGISGQRGLSQQFRVLAPALWLDECHTDLLGLAVVAEEYGEVVLGAGLHRDAVIAGILDTVASPAFVVVELPDALGVQLHVGGVVGMDAIALAHLDETQRVAWANDLPGRAGSPAVALGRREFERAVLNQFCIEAAIGTVVDVFEEDADEFVTNGFAALWGFHGFLGVQSQRRCHQEGSACC